MSAKPVTGVSATQPAAAGTDHSMTAARSMDGSLSQNKNTSKNVRPKTRSSKAKTKKSSSADDSQRKTEMEEKIRKRVALEEKAFRLVEQLLENPITEQFLIDAGQYITPDHYGDVVEERSISSTCGYPICSKPLRNVLKQKYHISTTNNTVYDITDRKKFCSSLCYKASQYYEQQISCAPVWARDVSELAAIKLLPTNCSSGKMGEAIINPPELEIRQELQKLDTADRIRIPRKPQKGIGSACHKPETAKSQVDSSFSLSCEGHTIGAACHHSDQSPANNLEGGISNPQDREVLGISKDIDKLQIDPDTPAESRKGGEPVLLADLAENIAQVCVEECEKEKGASTGLGHQLESQLLDGSNNTQPKKHEHVNAAGNTVNSTRSLPTEETSPVEGDNLDSGRTCLIDNVELFSPRSVPSPTLPATIADSSGKPDTAGSAKSTKTDTLADKACSVENASGSSSVRARCDPDCRDGDGNDRSKIAGDLVMGVEHSWESTARESAELSETEMYRKQTLNEWRTTTPNACKHQPPSDVVENSAVSSVSVPVRSVEGAQTKQTAIAVTQQKTALLMELLDKRDSLRQKSVGDGELTHSGTSLVSTEANDNIPSIKSGPKTARRKFVACIDDYAIPKGVTASNSTKSQDVSSQHGRQCVSDISTKLSSNTLEYPQAGGAKNSPVTSKDTSVSTKPKPTKKQGKKQKVTPLRLMHQTLLSWKTSETVKMLNVPDTPRTPADSFEEKYAALTHRVDTQDMSNMIDEENMDEDIMGRGKLPSMQQLEKDAEGFHVKVKEFYGVMKHVGDVNAHPPGEHGDKSKQAAAGIFEAHTDKEVLLPTIDNLSQLTHRRKIVLDKLSRVFPELLGPLRMSIADVSGDLKLLVRTFNLTSTNILLKPAEWTLMAYFLLKLLSVTNVSLHQSLRGDVATHYFRTMLLSLNISETEVTKVVAEMCALNNSLH